MKQLTCEMCGSTNLLKQDDVFVCQSCGTKYSVEEAKKLMIEGTVDVQGTVKVDKQKELENYHTLANRARENKDYEQAEKYFDLILQQAPDDWEATFYATYCNVAQTNIKNISNAAYKLSNCLSSVFNLINKSKESIDIKLNYIVKVVFGETYNFSLMLYSNALSHFNEFRNSETLRDSAYDEYFDRCNAIYKLLLELGNQLEKHYGNHSEVHEMCATAWKRAIEVRCNYRANDEVQQQLLHYSDKVKKYDPSYQGVQFKKGCYVATCVYGSYDCPQVWTLRRFRDYTLSETWYGRAFIKIYYAISPTLVKWFGNTNWFKGLWKKPLDKMVETLNKQGFKDTKYDDKM